MLITFKNKTIGEKRMKNTLFAKLIAVLVVVCATIFVATACDFGFGEGESSSSVSSFYEQSESTFWENSSSLEDSSISEDSSSAEDSSIEDSSNENSSTEDSSGGEGGEDEEENGLQFNTVQIENNVGSISVPNATEKFSFTDEITVIGNAKYVVSLDEYGINTSLTKVVPLTVGDNLFYIFEMVNDEIKNTYLITVRRRPIYTVSFNTNGGTAIQSQRVEEGFFATLPEETPTRNGYDFISWAFDFSSPIMQTTSISANWSAVTYSLTYDLAGGVIEQANPNEYTIESQFTLTAPTREGYEFLGWYDGNTKITTLNGNYGNKTLTAKWESIFNYSNGVITGLKSKYQNLTQIVIPEEINGEAITSIGDLAFSSCDNLTSIEIPNSVTSIGDLAFSGCDSLEYNVKDNLNYLGNELNPYLYLSSVISQDITSAIIDNSCKFIGSYAFEDCSSLTSIAIPEGVTSIGERAFEDCESLQYNVKDNLNYLGNETNPYLYLSGVTSQDITSAIIDNSCKFIGSHAFCWCSSLTSVVIGDSVTSIGYSVFRGCSSLTSIVIPDSVTSIGSDAFIACRSLTSIVIPDSVTSIGDLAFYYCSSLTNIEVDKNNANYKSIDGNLYSKDGKTLIQYAIGKTKTSFVIPDSVTSIGERAFEDCDGLTSVVIGDSVTSIGKMAFYGCDSLEYNVKDNLKYLGNETNPYLYLSGVTSQDITSAIIDNSCKFIGSYAFASCSSLTSVVIPDSITSIGKYAFYNCSSLTNIEVDKNNANYKSIDGNLYSKDGKTLIQYAIGKTKTSFVIPDSVTSIGERAFEDCRTLTSIVIPDSVTSIGSYAFSGCRSLTSVVIADSVTSIGDWAFSNCSSLTSIKYLRTEEEWNAISKDSSWDSNTGNYTITYNYTGE